MMKFLSWLEMEIFSIDAVKIKNPIDEWNYSLIETF